MNAVPLTLKEANQLVARWHRHSKPVVGARFAIGLGWEFSALSEWTPGDPQKLTVGIRDAYRNGLGIALPTGPKELGWTMEAE